MKIQIGLFYQFISSYKFKQFSAANKLITETLKQWIKNLKILKTNKQTNKKPKHNLFGILKIARYTFVQ